MAPALHGPDSRPKLRPELAAEPDGDGVVVYDPYRVGGPPVVVTRTGFEIIRYFNGTITLLDLAHAISRDEPPLPLLTGLADTLEQNRFLDGPAFRSFLALPVRPSVCVGGVFPADPAAFRLHVRQLFHGPGGAGLPTAPRPANPIRGVLVPHMDFGRGNRTYGHGFKELVERTDADLFFVVATSHYSPARFSLTRMDFETPLGVVETDRTIVDRIADLYGDTVFEDSLAHFPEHSIELEVVILHALREGRPFRIVPLLVGSFGDCVRDNLDPMTKPDIARMVEVLRQVEAEAGEKVCYIVSGDLAHIGPKFGDPAPVAAPQLTHSRLRDDAILRAVEAADPAAYFRVVADEKDDRRICGFPPTWLTLAAARPGAGRTLDYQQYVHPEGHESVSFAAAAFDP